MDEEVQIESNCEVEVMDTEGPPAEVEVVVESNCDSEAMDNIGQQAAAAEEEEVTIISSSSPPTSVSVASASSQSVSVPVTSSAATITATINKTQKVKKPRFRCCLRECKGAPNPTGRQISRFTIRPPWVKIIRKALGDPNWKPGTANNLRNLCSLHFESTDMYTLASRRRVKEDRVPKLLLGNHPYGQGPPCPPPLESFITIEDDPDDTVSIDLPVVCEPADNNNIDLPRSFDPIKVADLTSTITSGDQEALRQVIARLNNHIRSLEDRFKVKLTENFKLQDRVHELEAVVHAMAIVLADCTCNNSVDKR